MNKFVVVSSRARSLINFRRELLLAIQLSGFAVHVVCPASDSAHPAVEQLRQLNIRVHFVRMERAGTNVFSDVALWAQLFLLFRTLRPDALLAYTIKPIIYGLTAGVFARVPRRFALVTGLGYTFSQASLANSLHGLIKVAARGFYRLALRAAHTVFFQNPDDRALFLNLGLVRDSVSRTVNGSGVDLERYVESQLDTRKPHFVFIGRLLRAKGVREFAAAGIELRRRFPAVKVSVVGWIDDNPDSISREELTAWVEEGISFLGEVDDVRPILRDCSVFVLPSYREGTPRTVLEAMAIGRAIITTDAPGCRETVSPGENGYLVPAQSVQPLVEAMLKFVEDPALAIRMGRRSREIAEAKYDVHKVNAEMLAGMGLSAGP